MWKKDDEQTVRPTVATAPSPEPVRPPAVRPSTQATIGPSIVVRGEVSGNEDLLIQGKVDGSVALDLHSVTVGGGGRVKANISGRVITIEGDVEGDLTAQEQIVLRGSASVLGDLKAPRVVLEDGATFRGLVDMGAPRQGEERAASQATAGPATGAAASGGASGVTLPRSGVERERPASPLDSGRPKAAKDTSKRGAGP